jgi:hypothetical protein
MKMLNTEDQRQIRIAMGTTIFYKYIDAGTVTLSDNNVACEGGEIKIRGKKHENVVKLVTVSFTMKEINVFEKKGRLKIEAGQLPRACSLAFEGCSLEDFTLVLDLSKINLCPYNRIRTAEFDYIRDKETNGTMVINDEHKMLFIVGEQMEIPAECNLKGTLTKTNFERLFLYPGTLGIGIDLIDPAEVDLELETRASDYFLAYWSQTVVKESEVRWQNEVCLLSSSKLNNDQTILHENHLLKMQGELISEFVCTPITVRTRAGHKMEGDVCLDHLPVFMPDNQIGYLTPMTRILTQRNAVSVVNCSAHYPYLFEDKQGRMVSANPAVQAVKVELTDHHFLDANSRNHSNVFKFSSLLYTPEEIMAYEQMLQGHNAERAVTRKFSSYYCETTGSCMPSRNTQDFQWNRLLDPAELMSEWWEDVKTKILWWGALWGVLDSILTLLQFFIKMILVCTNIGKRQLTSKSIFKFVFLPGHELINLFPVQRETRAEEYHPAGRYGHISTPDTEMESMIRSDSALGNRPE